MIGFRVVGMFVIAIGLRWLRVVGVFVFSFFEFSFLCSYWDLMYEVWCFFIFY